MRARAKYESGLFGKRLENFCVASIASGKRRRPNSETTIFYDVLIVQRIEVQGRGLVRERFVEAS